MILNRYYSTLRNKDDSNAIKIYWATDLHLYSDVDGKPNAEGASGTKRYYYTSGQKLQNFVDDVNRRNPDLSYFSGDLVEGWSQDYEGSTELFMNKWSKINTRRELTIGNHDVANGGANVANTEMADLLGYGDKPIIAGSKYNQSFYLDNGVNRVKIISFDTNLNDSGNHTVLVAQKANEDIRSWVKSELLNSTTESVILFSHACPNDDSLHFNADDSVAFKTMINDVTNQRPELKMYSLAGHNHRQGIIEYPTDNQNIKYYTVSPVVDFILGKYTVVSFSEKYGLKLSELPLPYPYP